MICCYVNRLVYINTVFLPTRVVSIFSGVSQNIPQIVHTFVMGLTRTVTLLLRLLTSTN